MMPPCCCLCGADFFPPDGGDLVHFALTPQDAKDLKAMEANHISGHPPNAEWFCAAHLEQAQQLKGHALNAALQVLRDARL